MKILSPQQLRNADAITINRQGINSIDLMERASKYFVEIYKTYFSKVNSVCVFCGPGNNGGDGLAISRLLLESGYEVKTYIAEISSKYSDDFLENKKRLSNTDGNAIIEISSLPKPEHNSVIIDAIFGTGLNKCIEGYAVELITYLNSLPNKKVAVDIPSGLYADKPNQKDDVIFKADYTISFHSPKFSFFIPENADFTGDWQVCDIGIEEDYISGLEVKENWISESIVKEILKPRKKNSHKGTYGHALIWAGSQGKMGAAVLAARACVHTGAGLTTAHIPGCGYEVMQTALPEVMVSIDNHKKYLASKPDTRTYQAVGAGCGIGTETATKEALSQLMRFANKTPLVLDADALNIISENTELLDLLPENTILTPHPKEFDRLTSASENDWVRYQKAKEFSLTHQCILILKGCYTSIHLPNGNTWFNTTGSAGMAKGGSGDVLTGIITSLLAQKYSSEAAAILGVWIHGKAGKLATAKHSVYAVTASDLILEIGNAYKSIEKNA